MVGGGGFGGVGEEGVGELGLLLLELVDALFDGVLQGGAVLGLLLPGPRTFDHPAQLDPDDVRAFPVRAAASVR